jgi:hypothetical protein
MDDPTLPGSGSTEGEDAGGTGTLTGAGDSDVASTTLARHLPQNLSPGFITCPQDRHTRVPACCEGCGAGGGIYCVWGDCGALIAAGTVDGAGMPSPFTGLPHPPQNRVPGFRVMPHEVQESEGEGSGAGVG